MTWLNFCFQGKYTFDELPYLIFGSLSLLAAVVVYFVPETYGKDLPNTIEEIEGTVKEDNNDVELANYYNHGQDIWKDAVKTWKYHQDWYHV